MSGKDKIQVCGAYLRKGRKYEPSEILPLLETEGEFWHSAKRIELDGDLINIRSSRMRTFRRSLECVCCGIRGVFFVKERHQGQLVKFFHLNLYAIDKDGNEILMTSDHIVPRCKHAGLKNNRQTMCSLCNQAKGNREISIEDLRIELGVNR